MTQHLICPLHKPRNPRMVETMNGTRVRCPECGNEWQNFLKYPVAELFDCQTGETFRQNVLTGERYGTT